jgi:hypothetical protein
MSELPACSGLDVDNAPRVGAQAPPAKLTLAFQHVEAPMTAAVLITGAIFRAPEQAPPFDDSIPF